MVTSPLKARESTGRVYACAWSILGPIQQSYNRLTMNAFRLLYASHVRPRLEYGGAETYPQTAGELDKLERVQRADTRLVVGLRGTSYEGRLPATAIVVEEKTNAAFKRRLDEHLKERTLVIGPSTQSVVIELTRVPCPLPSILKTAD
ncbi:unnamed protein product [Echinostoma caproni]|uniref:PBP_domain domain-containing protein n=1 Tax=Echinostoma caproni TaxID=27848 RepID=A0A183A5R6_9TREM|nr:unnamed protein product [Echinostoma caproni]